MEVTQIGNCMKSGKRENPNQGRVYDAKGICPTLTDMQGGGRQPMIIDDVIIGGMQEHQSVKKDGICTCLTSSMGTGGGYVPMIPETIRIKQATSQGYIECEVGGVADLSLPDSKTRRGKVQENGQVSPTLMAGEQDICRIENVYDFYNNNLKTDGVCGTLTSACSHNGSGTFGVIVPQNVYLSEKGKKYVCDPKRGMCTDINADVCQTLTAKGQSNWTGSFVSPDIDSLEKSTNIGSSEPALIHLKDGTTITSNDSLAQYRIRKLTPRECWRLMDFTDEDFEKAEQVNSRTQLYKQAGNSIVKNVLVAILGQMIPGKEEVYKKLETR